MQDKLFILPSRQAVEPERAEKSNLPAQLTPLLGREAEVQAACTLLRRPQVRLLTLTGMGGIGKTRLGLEIATELNEDFAHGIFFVPLAPISDPDLVLPTIAQRLELKAVVPQPLLDQLKAFLWGKHLLLLLDNFEQVVSAASLLVELLKACPTLKVVVTSRAALHVSGEHEFSVPPLAIPDLKHLSESHGLMQYAAVALFIQRAQAIKPNFQLTKANARALAEICSRLDGLPLAIELAAARIKLLPPQALLARLEHRLQILTNGAQDVPVRQQTLRNTITWSYDLLGATEQRLFQQLSVFVGGCTLEAAEAVCSTLGDAASVLDGVALLIDKSLLQQTEQEGKESRLLMLETIREYAIEALAASGEVETTRRAHALYYLGLAEEELEGIQQTVWLDRLERDHDNVRAALQWSLERAENKKDEQSLKLALRLGGALGWFWEIHGHVREGRNFLERVLMLSEEVVGPAQAKALQHAGILASYQHDYERAQVALEESLVLFRAYGDSQSCAYTLRILGRIALDKCDYKETRLLLEEAVALAREVSDTLGVTIAREILGWSAFSQGDYTSALAIAEECLEAYHALNQQRGLAGSLLLSGRTIFSSQGDHVKASKLLEESLALSREVGDQESIADSLVSFGKVFLHRGDVDTAHELAQESYEISREIGSRLGMVHALSLLAGVAFGKGDYTAAHALYHESLTIAWEAYGKEDIAACLDGLASVVAAEEEPVWAVHLFGTAEALRENIGIPIPPVECAAHELAVANLRTRLGAPIFALIWSEGRALTPEQVLSAQGRAAMLTPIPAEQPSTPPAKAPRHPAGLTEREVEVLLLVAQGLTNAQIAERLIVSPHTVHAHVRSIHSKLGVTSRSAVTRYAFEHHLS